MGTFTAIITRRADGAQERYLVVSGAKNDVIQVMTATGAGWGDSQHTLISLRSILGE